MTYKRNGPEKPISMFLLTSVLKRVLVHNLSYVNEFDLQENERARKTNFNMKGFEPILVLKRR